MPALDPTPTPRRNVIGAEPMGVTANPRSPALLPQDTFTSRRPVYAKMKVISPAGDVEEHYTYNARDLINHLGWSEYKEPDSDREKEDGNGQDSKTDTDGLVLASESSEDEPAFEELKALREELRAMGVVVDQRKGLRRLREELAALKEQTSI